MQILANTPNGLKNKKASEKGSHIIKSKLLIHFNSFKKDLRLWVGCLAGRGGGRETPHQTSDWFKRGPAKPHSLKGKDGLGFRETPETSPRKRWLWLEVAAELRGPGAPPLSGRLPPGERGGWLEAGRALQLGSAKSPLCPSRAPPPIVLHSPGPPVAAGVWNQPPLAPLPWPGGISEKGRAPAPPTIGSQIRQCRQVRGRGLAWPRGPAAGRGL